MDQMHSSKKSFQFVLKLYMMWWFFKKKFLALIRNNLHSIPHTAVGPGQGEDILSGHRNTRRAIFTRWELSGIPEMIDLLTHKQFHRELTLSRAFSGQYILGK